MSANFGELIPVTCIETVPGDYVEVQVADLLRAIPMVTSPFMRAKQHIDVWFVPYHDLWHNFNQFITQKTEPMSSALNSSQYLPWFNMYELRQVMASFDTAGYKDVVGRNYLDGANRLMNYLGYGNNYGYPTGAVSPSCNPFRIAAYNYIWYNEYRQQYYDSGLNILSSVTPTSSPEYASYLWNYDGLQCDSLANAELTASNIFLDALASGLQMRYRCWKKDLFTGLLPSTQFGAVSILSSVLDNPVRISNNNSTPGSSVGLYNNQLAMLDSGGSFVANSSDWNLNNPSTARSVTSSIDVLSLRRSEAIQIWRENALRAGNRVKDNMNAHYGIESDFRDHRPTYLGSVSSPLNIGDVMTTANSSTGVNDSVGDIAGKGLSSMDEKLFKFNSKDFGVIMAIASILPEAEYNATGISRPNQLLEAEDFFIPEYENLGLEAVSSQTFVEVPTTAAKVIGYAPRYWGYKTKLDKCYDLFQTNGINAPWCSPKYDVSSALAVGTVPTVLPLSILYVNPKIFDVNFSVGVDVQPQFLCDYYFDVDAVRPMSVVGLPFS